MPSSSPTDPFRYMQDHVYQGWAGADPLDLPITSAQRERSERYLQDAYAQGRLSKDDFDRRIDRVLSASTRRELNAAFEGFVRVPLAQQAVGLHPIYRPLVNEDRDGQVGRWMGTLAHWSGPFTWIIGPGLLYTLARRGSYARAEAAKAFNTQIGVVIVWAVLAVVGHLFGFAWVTSLWWVVAAVIAIVSGIRAHEGERWTNPIQRAVPIRLLDEGQRDSRQLRR